jgi:hypothetical protein
VVFRKELVITVRRRDGRVEERRIVVDKKVGDNQNGDLLTLWAFRLIRCYFLDVTRGTTVVIDVVDLGGTSRRPTCIGNINAFLGSECTDRFTFIGFGSDPTPPSRTDYRLLGELARVRAFQLVFESDLRFVIFGSWTPDSNVTVCEVGLYLRVCDAGGVGRFLLIDRSVLDSCINVGAGETISVTYTFQF